MVARENFGLNVAQVAAMSLLIDYTLTVAVSVAAGVAAITSVVPSLVPYTTWIAIGLVILLAFGNLRGIREAGRTFAVPTYFFIANMVLLIAWGIYKVATGTLHAHPITGHPGSVPVGSPASGLLYGATVFVAAQGVRLGGLGPDRNRGHLQRRERLPQAGVSQRPDHHGLDGHDPRVTRPRGLRAGLGHPSRALRVGHPDGDLPGCQVRLRDPGARRGALCHAPDRDHPDPHPGGQHELHRVSLPRQLRGRGLLSPPPADQARASPGVLDRHHRADRSSPFSCSSSPGRGWTA